MEKKLKVWVYGAGAVGCYYGSQLLRSGGDVSFITRSETGKQFIALTKTGLKVNSLGCEFVFPAVRVVSENSLAELESPDLILVCTKTYSNPQVINNLKNFFFKNPDSKPVIFVLQNGISSHQAYAEEFNQNDFRRVFRGIMNIACSLSAPGEVVHKSGGLIILEAGHFVANQLYSLFTQQAVECKLSANIDFDIWNKALWNAPFNSVTAISRLTTTPVLQDPDGLYLIKKLSNEVCQLADSEGVSLASVLGQDGEPKIIEQKIQFTLHTLGDITTSTREDLLANRELECEAIVGDLIKVGLKNKLQTPYLDSVYRFLKLLNLNSKKLNYFN